MTFKVWGTEDITRLNAGNKNNITELPNGGYVVSWSESDNKVYFQRYDGAGQKVGGRQAIDSAGDRQIVTDIQAYGSDGDFVVSWNETNGSSNGWSIKSRVFKADGTVKDTQVLASNLSIGNLDRPAIASTSNGGFVTAYDNGTSIVFSVHNADGTIIAPIQNVIDNGNAEYADIVAIGDDKYIVSYSISGTLYYRTMHVNSPDEAQVQIGAGSRSYAVALENADGNATGGYAVVYNAGSSVKAMFRGDGISTDIELTKNGLNDGDFVSATALRGGRVAVVYIEKVLGSVRS